LGRGLTEADNLPISNQLKTVIHPDQGMIFSVVFTKAILCRPHQIIIPIASLLFSLIMV
jgi:hypothetical protein